MYACRVCLANDREMYRLANTALEETYERISGGKLCVEPWPCCVCGVCLSALRRCRQLIETARGSNEVLAQWLRNQPHTDTLQLVERPLFSLIRTPVELFDTTSDKIRVKEEIDMSDNNTVHHKNEVTFENESNILMQEIKEEIRSDDDNDCGQVSDIETHKLQGDIHNRNVLQFECVNVQENIQMKMKTLQVVKKEDSEVLDYLEIAPNAVDDGRNSRVSTEVEVPLQKFGSRKSIELNNEPESSRTTSEHQPHQNTNTTAALNIDGEISKPFACDKCDYRSKIQYYLNRHLKTHTDEKPFQCNKCNFKCNRLSSLTRHLLGHTSEKPFVCHKCNYSCIEKFYLKRHLLTHADRSDKMRVKEETDMADSSTVHHKNEVTFENESNILMQEIKEELRSDDDNDCGQVSDKETHKIQVDAHNRNVLQYECVNVQENIQMKMNTIQVVKTEDSEVLDYLEIAPTAVDDGRNRRVSTEVEVPLQKFRSRNSIELNEEPESSRIPSEHQPHQNTNTPAPLNIDGDTSKPFACDKCDYRSKLQYYLNRHLKTHTDEKPFQCDKCNFKCNRLSSLTRHLLGHTSEKPFACDKCNYSSNEKFRLKQHLVRHTKEKSFECNKCNFKCKQKFTLERHLLRHTSEQTFACNKCNYTTNVKCNLNKHLRTHVGEKSFACDQCDCIFRKKYYLKRHLLTHTGEKLFMCDICDYKCQEKYRLIPHLRTHSGEKPFTCDKCDYKCGQKKHLKQHLMKHTREKPFACDMCNYRSNQRANLKNHIRTHSGEKPFACHLCDLKFIENGQLKKHLLGHTGEKPFACNLCEYRTTTNANFQRHFRIHTGEKPFACNLCDYRTTTNGNFQRHLRIHTGEKPFACHICDFKCIESKQLKHHVMGHTGEKPFACNVCEYKTTTSSNFQRHLRIHTGEKPFACHICDFKCIESNKLKHHVMGHTGEKPFACSICDYRTIRNDDLDRHYLTTHSAE